MPWRVQGVTHPIPSAGNSCHHQSNPAKTARHLLHEPAAATVLPTRAATYLEYGERIQPVEPWSTTATPSHPAHLVAHCGRERDERHVCRCRIGRWLDQAAFCRTEVPPPLECHIKSGRFGVRLVPPPRERGGPPPHQTSGSRGLRVIGKVAEKGRIRLLAESR